MAAVYRYCARAGHYTGRWGSPVRVIRWHRSKALVRFGDGWLALVPGRCLRKLKPPVAARIEVM